MFIPCTATVFLVLGFDVVLEIFSFFVGCSCRPCAVVAVVRSSSMVIVCLSESLMRNMSSCELEIGDWLLLFRLSVA